MAVGAGIALFFGLLLYMLPMARHMARLGAHTHLSWARGVRIYGIITMAQDKASAGIRGTRARSNLSAKGASTMGTEQPYVSSSLVGLSKPLN